jgi:hypothetical protein
MQQVSNPFQAMKDIFVKPNRVFATISETHNWSWIPFICVAVIGAIPVYMYFNFVDFSWYTELMVQSMAGELSPAEQNMVRHSMTDQAQSLWAGVFSSILVVILSNAILALYLNILTKADEECLSPTSVAFIFNLDMDSAWFSFAQSIRLESFWVMYLIAVGLSQWTQLPSKKTTMIAVAPYVFIWTVWALIVLL